MCACLSFDFVRREPLPFALCASTGGWKMSACFIFVSCCRCCRQIKCGSNWPGLSWVSGLTVSSLSSCITKVIPSPTSLKVPLHPDITASSVLVMLCIVGHHHDEDNSNNKMSLYSSVVFFPIRVRLLCCLNVWSRRGKTIRNNVSDRSRCQSPLKCTFQNTRSQLLCCSANPKDCL